MIYLPEQCFQMKLVTWLFPAVPLVPMQPQETALALDGKKMVHPVKCVLNALELGALLL